MVEALSPSFNQVLPLCFDNPVINSLSYIANVVRYVIELVTWHWTTTTEWTIHFKVETPTQLFAMVACHNPANDQMWYADSGATNHITNDLKNMSIH